ncbi:MAG: 4Fe-4S binding protein, partial [Deltaproteobacteria bacterium]|nr:4Fe-4S binding protein [Deltaproteobacteria bacterium]
MSSNTAITPSTLSLKDLPWQVLWDKDKCTLCGRCTTVCPVNAIELGVFRKRIVETSLNSGQSPSSAYKTYNGIRQKTNPAYAGVGCAMCTIVCPNDAIIPARNHEEDKLKFHVNQAGHPRRRGGR